jgi:hypothetical protein
MSLSIILAIDMKFANTVESTEKVIEGYLWNNSRWNETIAVYWVQFVED